ncbi:MAG: ferrous iron transport protein A [Deltaproteobacteria bacterium]|nr:ferrous iron transport protein A [Deltaproteobacteria bacterium]
MKLKSLLKNNSLEKERESMPLTMALPGEEFTLLLINGGRGIKLRLYSMGLTPGVKLKVLNNGAPGPFLLSVRDFRVAIGYGMAKKIIVK